ncbi:acetolactate decarboxylase [Paenibacillus apiarius]|uniref:acetolactate decarboxylase n=1 Tax=Paenibacillus apiarius TaxID=46240 RepID=UPI00197FAA82|nr:acetolactate decarboxylase [Paenibacillus apiarius]MBN3523977.1 acetolactate decarboxylase [Paenibacillus apiarius]
MNAVLQPMEEQQEQPKQQAANNNPLAGHAPRGGASEPVTIFQTSTMSALLDGVYEGSMTMKELARHGDFGLGTFDELDGELIAFDGEFYHLRHDGSVNPVHAEEMTPFASVTYFQPETTFTIDRPMSRTDLEALIDGLLPSENLFYALRMDGQFEQVVTRTVTKQKRPYPTLVEATKSQPVFTLNQVEGTMAGFRMPAFAQGLSVAGYHLHFVDDDRTGGGHVLDFTLLGGTVQIGQPAELHLHFPETAGFMNADLTGRDVAGEIEIAEGGASR